MEERDNENGMFFKGFCWERGVGISQEKRKLGRYLKGHLGKKITD